MRTVRRTFEVENYNLDSTLDSGQAFRWERAGTGWESVIGRNWVRLEKHPRSIVCETASDAGWDQVADYLQIRADLNSIIATFPKDAPMRAALESCKGLRLLKQDPWEVLGSFILSSTKQIVQIKQVVAALCRCFGEAVPTPQGRAPMHAFPSAARLATATEAELRACKMGFRAPYLKAAALAVASGHLDLQALAKMPVGEARGRLEELPGVGPKIANCVLLSAYNFSTAFPLDVWILRALKGLYFAGKRPSLTRLRAFSESHFGPWSGYAQLYLFHYVRVVQRKKKGPL